MRKSSNDSRNTSRNTSSRVREYKVWELQEHAKRLTEKVFPSGHVIPIEIESIAYHLGLDINPIPGLAQACQVHGALWRDDGGQYWIVVDEHIMDSRENRYRFTVAEEIAHFVLHQDQIDQAADVRGAIELQGRLASRYRFFEANARRLAAEMLMPRDSLRQELGKAYRDVVGVVGFRNLQAAVRQVTDILRRKYVVSYSAMENQLRSHEFRAYEAMNRAFQAQSTAL